MVRYWYAVSPGAVLVGTLVILSSPYLAMLALLGVLLAALGAIAVLLWAIGAALYRLPGRVLAAIGGGSAQVGEARLPVDGRGLGS
jgi:hypothetical protein